MTAPEIATAAVSTAAATSAALHSRACAVVTAASCLAHAWLAAGSHHGPWLSALMLAMVAVCVPCAVHVWRHSSVAALRRVMASGVAMAVLHSFLLLAPAGSAHSHGGSGPAAAAAEAAIAGEPEGPAAALLAVIALEITTAFLASTLVARLRARL